MCANLASLSVKDKTIEKLCRQIYCEFAEEKAEFCTGADPKTTPDKEAEPIVDDSVIVTRTLVAAATFAVACAVLATLYLKLRPVPIAVADVSNGFSLNDLVPLVTSGLKK
jgi:hypothetical protein